MMMNTTIQHPAEPEIERLESRVVELIEICERLRAENLSLRERLEFLSSERANLAQKNEQSRVRVEAMISRLKTLEYGA
jgi:cell division protein ZapB